MDIEYEITEIVHQNSVGKVTKVDYQFDETIVIESSTSSSSTSIARQNREKRNRQYDVTISYDQYQKIANQLSN
ncbi:unnamed protein product, partial [Rotaria sp. Silwood1]